MADAEMYKVEIAGGRGNEELKDNVAKICNQLRTEGYRLVTADLFKPEIETQQLRGLGVFLIFERQAPE